MKQLKRIACLSLVSVLFAASSLAEGAPTSQFGVNNWPYRNPNSACGTATNQPQDCATATPAPAPSAQPTARPTAAPTNSGNPGDYTTVSVSAQEYSAWNLLNADREANGLAALPLDQELCRIARIKSCDMKTNGYFAHESPTYGSMAAMLKRFGYSYQGVGENIAHHATVNKADAAFMSSTGHRANILGSQWTKVGIGVCYDDQGYVYVTQVFAR